MTYRFALAAAALAFSIAASPVMAEQYSGVSSSPPPAATTPPVFKDAAPTTPPPLPAGTPGNSAAPAAPAKAAAAASEPVPVPADPCASSQGSYDAYTVCQDMIQKIERMKKGNAARQDAYRPAPPPEEKKPEEAKKEEPKTDEKKDDDKKDEAKTDDKSGDKAADAKTDAKADAKTTDAKTDVKAEAPKAPVHDPNEYGASSEYGANTGISNLERP